MIARLALRVARLRKERGLPRRVLSEMSGVSPRYLAQLEAGGGNISVLLLQRVAMALGVSIEALLSSGPTQNYEADRLSDLFQQAPDAVQAQVRALLVPQDPTVLRDGRVCLIGLRGAGKSSLGRKAAQRLEVPFVELSDEIEEAADMPMAEVQVIYGEAGVRRMEAEALARVSGQFREVIVAVDGGIVSDEKIYGDLLDRFHTVWIRTSPGEHMQRIRGQNAPRAVSDNPAAMEQLKTLLALRTPLYAKAEAQVNTANRDIAASLEDLLTVMEKHRFIPRQDASPRSSAAS